MSHTQTQVEPPEVGPPKIGDLCDWGLRCFKYINVPANEPLIVGNRGSGGSLEDTVEPL